MFPYKRLLSILTFFTLLATPVIADDTLSLKAGYLSLVPSGEVSVSVDGLMGNLLDVEDDLDIEESGGLSIDAALQLGAFRLFAAYLPIRLSGESMLKNDIDFKGETFVIGSRVESDINIDIYEAGLAWFLVNVDDLPVRIQFGPEIAMKYIDARIRLQDNVAGLSEAEGVGVMVPSLGARAKVSIADYLSVVGRVGYLKYNTNSFLDIDGQIEYSPIPAVGLFAGYRYLDVDVNDNDVLIDATFAGPYAGLLVRF